MTDSNALARRSSLGGFVRFQPKRRVFPDRSGGTGGTNAVRFALLIACAALALVTVPACKRPDTDGDESAAAEEEGSDETGTDDDEGGSDDDPGDDDDEAGDGDDASDDFDPGPAKSETFPDDGWSEALADQWLPNTVAVVVASPENLLDALDTTRSRLADPMDREAFESLLTRLPTDLIGLVRVEGWTRAGLDSERPVAIWLSAGPSNVLDVFDALQKEAVGGGGDVKVRGTQIHTALQQLVLHVRLSLPYTQHEDVEEKVQSFLGSARPIGITGYERAFATGTTIVAMRREGTRLVVDAVASQGEDPVVTVAAHLTALEPPEPTLPRPDEDALVWAAFDVDVTGKLDALYGATQGAGSRPEGLVRAMTAEGAFGALTLSWTPDALAMRGHFREPQPAAVAALAAAPRVDRAAFGDDVGATLEFLAATAAPEGPWADLGFIPPRDELAEWKLESFIGKSGPIVFALPLWLPMVPAVAWSFVPPDQQHLDPATNPVVQVAVPRDFSLLGPTLRATVTWPKDADPAAGLGCLVAGEPAGDCDPLATGSPSAATVGPLDLNVAYDLRDGVPVLAAATTPDALAALGAAAINTPSSADAVRVLSLRVDAAGGLLDAFLPSGPASPPDSLLDAVGWLELDVEMRADGLSVRLGTGDGRPLLTPLTDALVQLWRQFAPSGGQTMARGHLQRIGAGALISHATVGPDGTRLDGFPPSPEPSCVGTGSGKVDPSSVDWKSGPWETLGFRAWAPFDWKYCYQTSNDASRFALWADLDLDADGEVDQRLCTGGFVARGEPVLRMLNRARSDAPCLP